MSSSPKWKIYRSGKYVAACKHAEDAAALVSVSGGTVKLNHRLVVWMEGHETISAGESYDRAAEIMHDRAAAHARRQYAKAYGHINN